MTHHQTTDLRYNFLGSSLRLRFQRWGRAQLRPPATTSVSPDRTELRLTSLPRHVGRHGKDLGCAVDIQIAATDEMANLDAGLPIAQLVDHRVPSYYHILCAVPANVGALDEKR